jgi:hypothetical protein
MTAFKTSRKEYLKKYALKMAMTRDSKSALDSGAIEIYRILKDELETLEKDYFSKLTKVFVSYSIGFRDYQREVVKIGKGYFQYGEAMTKSRGYYFIEEIPEITEEMKTQMLSDSYYY